MLGLSGSGDGATFKMNPLLNSIAHGNHHPMAVCDIFYCAVHMEGGNKNNSKFISDFMEVIMDGNPRK